MRAGKRSLISAAERKAIASKKTREWQLRRYVPNLAAGLTVFGKISRRKRRLSPETARLVAEYRQRQSRCEPEASLSPLEQLWRAERESMGDVSIPEANIRLRETI